MDLEISQASSCALSWTGSTDLRFHLSSNMGHITQAQQQAQSGGSWEARPVWVSPSAPAILVHVFSSEKVQKDQVRWNKTGLCGE